MKKITLFLAVIAGTFSLIAQQKLTISGIRPQGSTDPFQSLADFATSRTQMGETAGSLEENEVLEVQVLHRNLPANPANGSGLATIVVRYSLIGDGFAARGFFSANVDPLDDTEDKTTVINWTVTEATSGTYTPSYPEAINVQVFAGGNFGTTQETTGGFQVVPAGTLSSDSFETSDLEGAYYNGAGSIVIADTVSYSIFNLAGVAVAEGTAAGSINVAGLPSGVYILSTDAGILKFVK